MALKGNAAAPADPASAELHLMVDWQEPVTPRRIAIAAVGSLVFHFLALTVAGNLPNVPPPKDGPLIAIDLKKAIPLYMPKELTQRDPNAGKKITRTLDVRSSAPPAPTPQAPRVRAPEPVPAPSIPAPAIEAPKVEAAAPPPPAPSGGIPPVQTPVEKPKLAFENVGTPGPAPRPNPNPNFQLPRPASPTDAQMSASIRPSQGASGVVIGDVDEFNSAPIAGQSPASGPVRSNLQLLSDPKGVDFKPYLVQVLTAVRTNWLAVIPESARFGRKGRVLIQFIIDRKGAVPKLVIAESSGTVALDRAAVAGISASYPFPPLPASFQGEEIRLQLAFSYNVPSR
jgi:TonB family protein